MKNKLKPNILSVAIILVLILISLLAARAIILSSPQTMHAYLQFLNKNYRLENQVTIYTKEEFARQYLGQENFDNFNQLFQSYYDGTASKNNRDFIVYKRPEKDNPCLMQVVGLHRKKDLVFVSIKNICENHEERTK